MHIPDISFIVRLPFEASNNQVIFGVQYINDNEEFSDHIPICCFAVLQWFHSESKRQ